jgi:hypothetical protein
LDVGILKEKEYWGKIKGKFTWEEPWITLTIYTLDVLKRLPIK